MDFQRAPRRGKNVKKGVQFTVMVVGASGTGRTTFVNTLCNNHLLDHYRDANDAENAHTEHDVNIRAINTELDGESTRISLTVVDTPGFGDMLDNEESFTKILGYLERQYDEVLSEESRIKRNPRFRDNRVHAVLYFILPTGHGLRELDIELMRRLAPRANVIPVIGKSDTLTPDELTLNKRLIMEDIEHYRIPIYNFPYDIEEDDEETVEENADLRRKLPFALVGSEEVETFDDGSTIRVRTFPWGTVEVDNPDHCDFSALRSALLETHLADLKDITHDFLYENYRTEKLSRSVNSGIHAADVSVDSIDPSDLANQSVRIKEEQLRREEEKLREIELKVQRELSEKRQELLAREEQLRSLEARLATGATPSQQSLVPSETQ
ncbi:Cell division control protein 11 [Saitoella coloradoensis]